MGGDKLQWAKDTNMKGLACFEEFVTKTRGKYCFGDEVTLADAFLIPQLYNAVRFNIDLAANFPNTYAILKNLEVLPEFMKSHCDNQIDANGIQIPKLYYFDCFAKAEPCRMALNLAGIRFEDIRVTGPSWKELKESGKLEFGQMPMLELADGTQLVQSNSILRFLGAKYGLTPKDPMLAHKGDELMEHWGQDFFNKHMTKILYGKEEEREGMMETFTTVEVPKFFEKLAELLPSNEKYICGNKLTIYDCTVGGFFFNIVLNPNAKFADKWAKAWEKAPQRVKGYAANFGHEMKDYLDER